MRMFTKGIHYKMGECLYYKANVIIAEHKSYKQTLTYATKKIQSTFTVGLLWSPSGGFLISGLGIYCIVYRECSSFCCPRDSHLLGQFILHPLTTPIGSGFGAPSPPPFPTTHFIFFLAFIAT